MNKRAAIWLEPLIEEVIRPFGKRANPPRKAGYYWVSADGTRWEVWEWSGITEDGTGYWQMPGWDAPIKEPPAVIDERRILAPDEDEGFAW